MEIPDLKTDRLLIKLLEPKFSDLILQYYLRNKENFVATEALRTSYFYMLKYWEKQSAQSLLEFKNDQAVRFCLFDKFCPDQIIGIVNFTQIYRGSFQACYLGYSMDKNFENKGFMTEALIKATQYMFEELNLHRIMANYLPDNIQSAQVLKKLGFVIEGCAQKYLFINGEWRDHILTSLINNCWIKKESNF